MTDLVVLIGIPSEPPLALTVRALDRLGRPQVMVNQRHVARASLDVEVVDGRVGGVLHLDGQALDLDLVGGVYNRMMDHRLVPELCDRPPADPLVVHADELHRRLDVWTETMEGRVVNRLAAQASNASKPYQAQIIGHYFSIPETLVTTEPDALADFLAEQGRVVYKSISGTRSVVRELVADDLDRLDLLRWCPTQFQQRVEGVDVRVHTLADGAVFATAIESQAADWRYAQGQGPPARMRETTLDDALAQRCLALAAALDLDFAGIDLRIAPDGQVYCFEANPSPGFSAFEEATGQPIALALARYLAGGDGRR